MKNKPFCHSTKSTGRLVTRQSVRVGSLRAVRFRRLESEKEDLNYFLNSRRILFSTVVSKFMNYNNLLNFDFHPHNSLSLLYLCHIRIRLLRIDIDPAKRVRHWHHHTIPLLLSQRLATGNHHFATIAKLASPRRNHLRIGVSKLENDASFCVWVDWHAGLNVFLFY